MCRTAQNFSEIGESNYDTLTGFACTELGCRTEFEKAANNNYPTDTRSNQLYCNSVWSNSFLKPDGSYVARNNSFHLRLYENYELNFSPLVLTCYSSFAPVETEQVQFYYNQPYPETSDTDFRQVGTVPRHSVMSSSEVVNSRKRNGACSMAENTNKVEGVGNNVSSLCHNTFEDSSRMSRTYWQKNTRSKSRENLPSRKIHSSSGHATSTESTCFNNNINVQKLKSLPSVPIIKLEDMRDLPVEYKLKIKNAVSLLTNFGASCSTKQKEQRSLPKPGSNSKCISALGVYSSTRIKQKTLKSIVDYKDQEIVQSKVTSLKEDNSLETMLADSISQSAATSKNLLCAEQNSLLSSTRSLNSERKSRSPKKACEDLPQEENQLKSSTTNLDQEHNELKSCPNFEKILRLSNQERESNIWSAECIICNEKFTDRQDLYKHTTMSHRSTQIFSCDYCDKPFLNEKTLQEHREAKHFIRKTLKTRRGQTLRIKCMKGRKAKIIAPQISQMNVKSFAKYPTEIVEGKKIEKVKPILNLVKHSFKKRRKPLTNNDHTQIPTKQLEITTHMERVVPKPIETSDEIIPLMVHATENPVILSTKLKELKTVEEKSNPNSAKEYKSNVKLKTCVKPIKKMIKMNQPKYQRHSLRRKVNNGSRIKTSNTSPTPPESKKQQPASDIRNVRGNKKMLKFKENSTKISLEPGLSEPQSQKTEGIENIVANQESSCTTKLHTNTPQHKTLIIKLIKLEDLPTNDPVFDHITKIPVMLTNTKSYKKGKVIKNVGKFINSTKNKISLVGKSETAVLPDVMNATISKTQCTEKRKLHHTIVNVVTTQKRSAKNTMFSERKKIIKNVGKLENQSENEISRVDRSESMILPDVMDATSVERTDIPKTECTEQEKLHHTIVNVETVQKQPATKTVLPERIKVNENVEKLENQSNNEISLAEKSEAAVLPDVMNAIIVEKTDIPRTECMEQVESNPIVTNVDTVQTQTVTTKKRSHATKDLDHVENSDSNLKIDGSVGGKKSSERELAESLKTLEKIDNTSENQVDEKNSETDTRAGVTAEIKQEQDIITAVSKDQLNPKSAERLNEKDQDPSKPGTCGDVTHVDDKTDKIKSDKITTAAPNRTTGEPSPQATGSQESCLNASEQEKLQDVDRKILPGKPNAPRRYDEEKVGEVMKNKEEEDTQVKNQVSKSKGIRRNVKLKNTRDESDDDSNRSNKLLKIRDEPVSEENKVITVSSRDDISQSCIDVSPTVSLPEENKKTSKTSDKFSENDKSDSILPFGKTKKNDDSLLKSNTVDSNMTNASRQFSLQPVQDDLEYKTASSNLKFTCKYCNQSYSSEIVLNSHMLTHESIEQSNTPIVKPFILQCLYCPQEFVSLENLKNHSKEMHKKCATCKKVFETMDSLKEHEKSHEKKRLVLKCLYCSKYFTSLKDVRSHTKRIDKTCKTCREVFRTVKNREVHERTYVKKTIEQLELCDDTDKSEHGKMVKIGGSTYRKFCTDQKRSEADTSTCDKNEIGEVGLSLLTSHDTRVPSTDPTFAERSTLTKVERDITQLDDHAQRDSGTIDGIKTPIMKSQIETVSIDRNFLNTLPRNLISKPGMDGFAPLKASQSNRTKSDKDIHDADSETSTRSSSSVKHQAMPSVRSIQKVYPCTSCNKFFVEEQRLADHRSTVHFICQVCKRSFESERVLNAHILAHEINILKKEATTTQKTDREIQFLESGSNPFECLHCSCKFEEEYNLEIHMENHKNYQKKNSIFEAKMSAKAKNVKSFTCPICNIKFKSTNAMKLHVSQHQPRRNYKCKLCVLQSHEMFEAHIDDHVFQGITGGKPITCDQCNGKFITKQQYKQHRKSKIKTKCNYMLPNKLIDSLYCKTCNAYLTCSFICKHRSSYYAKTLVKCAWCTDTFDSLYNLNIHKFECGSRDSSCRSCNISFLSEESLQTHIVSFHKTEPKSCRFCDVTFEHIENRKFHESAHVVRKTHIPHNKNESSSNSIDTEEVDNKNAEKLECADRIEVAVTSTQGISRVDITTDCDEKNMLGTQQKPVEKNSKQLQKIDGVMGNSVRQVKIDRVKFRKLWKRGKKIEKSLKLEGKYMREQSKSVDIFSKLYNEYMENKKKQGSDDIQRMTGNCSGSDDTGVSYRHYDEFYSTGVSDNTLSEDEMMKSNSENDKQATTVELSGMTFEAITGNDTPTIKETEEIINTGISTKTYSCKTEAPDILETEVGTKNSRNKDTNKLEQPITTILGSNRKQIAKKKSIDITNHNKNENFTSRFVVKRKISEGYGKTIFKKIKANETNGIYESGGRLEQKSSDHLKKKVVQKHSCKKCNKSFETWMALNDHKIFVHDENFENSLLRNLLTVNSEERKSSNFLKTISSTNQDEEVPKSMDRITQNAKSKVEQLSSDQTFPIPRACGVHMDSSCKNEAFFHICEICGEILTSLPMVNFHKCMKVSTWYCSTCDKFYDSEVELRLHNTEVHLPQPDLLHAKMTCESCKDEFLVQDALDNHICKRKETESEPETKKKEAEHMCNYQECDKKFKTETELKRHDILRKHAPLKKCRSQNNKGTICEICKKSYASVKLFNNHMMDQKNPTSKLSKDSFLIPEGMDLHKCLLADTTSQFENKIFMGNVHERTTEAVEEMRQDPLTNDRRDIDSTPTVNKPHYTTDFLTLENAEGNNIMDMHHEESSAIPFISKLGVLRSDSQEKVHYETLLTADDLPQFTNDDNSIASRVNLCDASEITQSKKDITSIEPYAEHLAQLTDEKKLETFAKISTNIQKVDSSYVSEQTNLTRSTIETELDASPEITSQTGDVNTTVNPDSFQPTIDASEILSQFKDEAETNQIIPNALINLASEIESSVYNVENTGTQAMNCMGTIDGSTISHIELTSEIESNIHYSENLVESHDTGLNDKMETSNKTLFSDISLTCTIGMEVGIDQAKGITIQAKNVFTEPGTIGCELTTDSDGETIENFLGFPEIISESKMDVALTDDLRLENLLDIEMSSTTVLKPEDISIEEYPMDITVRNWVGSTPDIMTNNDGLLRGDTIKDCHLDNIEIKTEGQMIGDEISMDHIDYIGELTTGCDQGEWKILGKDSMIDVDNKPLVIFTIGDNTLIPNEETRRHCDTMDLENEIDNNDEAIQSVKDISTMSVIADCSKSQPSTDEEYRVYDSTNQTLICPYCDKSSSTEQLYYSHMKDHVDTLLHDIINVASTTDLSGQQPSTSEQFQEAKSTYKALTCPYCYKQFQDKPSYYGHMKDHVDTIM